MDRCIGGDGLMSGQVNGLMNGRWMDGLMSGYGWMGGMCRCDGWVDDPFSYLF